MRERVCELLRGATSAVWRRRRWVATGVAMLLLLTLLPWTRHPLERIFDIHLAPTGSLCNSGSGGASATTSTVSMAAAPDGLGYWLLRQDGGIFPYGDATGWGSAAGHIQTPATSIAPTPSGRGYWLVEQRGMVWAFGDARCFGGTYDAGTRPIVAIVPTLDGGGYWLMENNGGVWPFGDACGCGSASAPGQCSGCTDFVGMAATENGQGYWLLEANGGVWPYGNACGCGSATNMPHNFPFTGIANSPGSGQGYFVIGKDGGLWPFGAAQGAYGNANSYGVTDITSFTVGFEGHGYWFARSNGQVLPVGDAASLQ